MLQREEKKREDFFFPLKILFFTEGIIYCISHRVQGFSNLYVPTTTTKQPIPPGVCPFPCGFLPHLPFSFNCHNKTFFLKREDFSFSSPCPVTSDAHTFLPFLAHLGYFFLSHRNGVIFGILEIPISR